MILYDFIYEWDGKSKEGEKPIAWWPGAYRVRIVRIGEETTGVKYLFPVAVLLKPINRGKKITVSLRNYIHNFAKKISGLYQLDIDKTLWVEIGDEIRLAHLTPDRKLPDQILYTISWRPARPNELEMINPWITDL